MYYGLDIETDDPLLKAKGKRKACGTSWVFGEGEILVTGIYNHQTGEKVALDGNGGAKVKKLLKDPKAVVVGARIQYDIGWLCWSHKMDVKEVKCQLVDVSIVESVIDEYAKFSLDALSAKYLRERKGSSVLSAIAREHKLAGDFRGHLKVLWYGYKAKNIPAYKDEIRDYVMSDADQPVRIWLEQRKEVGAMKLWSPVVRKQKLIKVVCRMKQTGVRIDTAKKKENYELLLPHRERLQAEFNEKYGETNINSPKQLAEAFDRQGVPYRNKIRIKSYKGRRPFEGDEIWEQRKKLKNVFAGLRVIKGELVLFVAKQYAARTAASLENMGYSVSNNPSLGAKAIEPFKKDYQIARDVVDLKQVTSIITKFLGPAFDRFIAPDGRIHCDFNISGARKTGRMSSSAPNMQQVPSKTVLFRKTENEINLAKLCREIIIPDEGMLIGKMDYSGQENVLMAHFAVGRGAEEIRQKYRENPDFDFHAYMGGISGLYAEYGEESGRKFAKNCSFGLGYGMQIPTMMETFGWSEEQATSIMDAYNDAAPFVRATMDMASEQIVKRGYVRTLGGKKLHLPRYRGKVALRNAYTGFNKLIQGSAADMMEEALVRIYDEDLDLIYPLYLTVHDELDFGVPYTKEAINGLSMLKEIMENALLRRDGTPLLSVPIRVEPELGKNWGRMIDRSKEKHQRAYKALLKGAA